VNREEMTQEVVDRGYHYVQEARIRSSIERAYQQICAKYKWPFLETVALGEAPLEIADLRTVQSVKNKGEEVRLNGVMRPWLAYRYPDLTASGTPVYYYLEGNNLCTYPTSGEIEVVYFKRPAALGSSDEPLIPTEFQYLLIDRVIVDCLRDDDEYEEARNLKAEVDDGVNEMVHALMHRDHGGSRVVGRSGTALDYL
jgi:hypothetical protein